VIITWVANNGSATVTKLASNGSVLGTFGVGNQPAGIAFDGTNIRVANFGSNNVTKLLASNGSKLGTFPAGNGPSGIAFDGANIWVSNFGGTTVSKL
jgi:DNA-binding beta-propeller fold protein YncE